MLTFDRWVARLLLGTNLGFLIGDIASGNFGLAVVSAIGVVAAHAYMRAVERAEAPECATSHT